MSASRLLAAFVMIATAAIARDKTDVVIMKNGDHITCEIKRLEDGLLYLRASYTTAEFAVDWNLVARIQSRQSFVLRMSDGRILSGEPGETSKPAGEAEGTVPLVTHEEGPQELKRSEIVNIRQFGESFLKKIDGSIDYGFSLTKANSQTQSNLYFNATYRATKDIVSVTANSLLSSTADIDTRRNEFGMTYDRVFRQRWFARALSQFLQSDEQSLDLRSTYGGAVGRRMVDSNAWSVQMFAGGVNTNESYFQGPVQRQAEFITGLELENFHFDVSTLSFTAYVFPSISQFGRTRVNLNLQWNQKLIGNLKYRIGAFNNYDSQPPQGAARNDFGVTTGLGWTF